jgi:hypothetical protein
MLASTTANVRVSSVIDVSLRHLGRCVRLVVLCLAMCVTAAAQSGKPQVGFAFPGDLHEVRSPGGNLRATYADVASPPDEAVQYLFSIVDAHGRSLAHLSFIRAVKGLWAPDGERLYLNYFMGSTQIDCLVWSPGDSRLASLTESLLHDPKSGPVEGFGNKPPETPENSRFRLTCDGWRTADRISVTLEGVTWAGGQFKYELIYDIDTRKFNLDLTS